MHTIYKKSLELERSFQLIGRNRILIVELASFLGSAQSIRPKECRQISSIVHNCKTSIETIISLLRKPQFSQSSDESNRYRLLMSTYKMDNKLEEVSCCISQFGLSQSTTSSEKKKLQRRIVTNLHLLGKEMMKIEIEGKRITEKIVV